MIRNKSIILITSLLLLGAMTLIDTRDFYFEKEELVESREVDREELKESAEKSDWIQFSAGGNDFIPNEICNQLRHITSFEYQGITGHYSLIRRSNVPLFLKHCCLKIHLG
ncbi:hypothetical protein [Ekhidna sp.]|uniref:hypothetical protein n=1 Tax=Ekhidna sp. TaxID=2608089 RepID=UPI003297AD01